MPQIIELLEKRKKKFIKRKYRPWDLTGERQIADTGSTTTPTHSIKPEIELSSEPTEIATPLKAKTLRIDSTEVNSDKFNNTTLGNIKDNNIGINKTTEKEPLGNDLVTIGKQKSNNKQTIREQLDNELSPNSLKNQLQNLSGIQGQIFNIIANICLSRGENETGPIDTKLLSLNINTSYGSTKTSINRLIQKGFLSRKQGKRAKGGYINLGIPSEVIHVITNLRQQTKSTQLLSSILNTNPRQLDNKLANDLLHNSSNINNTTTIPEDWENIDITPLEEFGFNKLRLQQLVQFNSPSVVQESINHFAYALKHNPNTKKYTQDGKNPINVLMGVLRKGSNWFEANYESPKDKALREFLERKKKEKENREKIINDLMLLEFEDWRQALSEDEIKKIVPASSYNIKAEAPKTVALQVYYKNKILIPRLKKEGIL